VQILLPLVQLLLNQSTRPHSQLSLPLRRRNRRHLHSLRLTRQSIRYQRLTLSKRKYAESTAPVLISLRQPNHHVACHQTSDVYHPP
jgi:hypothetical protein